MRGRYDDVQRYQYSIPSVQTQYQTGYTPPITRPTAGLVLSILGGVFVVFGGLALLLVQGTFGFYLSGIAAEAICAPIGFIIGVVMILGAVDAYVRPQRKVIWGTIIIILSLASWVFALGGMIFGSVLGLAGGILIVAHKTSLLPAPPQLIIREREVVKIACRNCGAIVDFEMMTCPYCGRSPR
jgi:hypothetical protein